MFRTANPAADAERHFDMLDAADRAREREVQETADAFIGQMLGNPYYIVDRVTKLARDELAPNLDGSADLTEAARILILAARGENVQEAAEALIRKVGRQVAEDEAA